jgi:ElaB/YqjD/DUF883 family membrane-anchored ribosome-binding protein
MGAAMATSKKKISSEEILEQAESVQERLTQQIEQARQRLNESVLAAKDRFGDARMRAADSIDDARVRAGDTWSDMTDYVRENPGKIVAASLGVGIAVGVTLRLLSNRRAGGFED